MGPRAVEAAIKKWGRLDAIVVNHGGLEPVKKIAEASVGEWKDAFDSGVFGGVGLVSLRLGIPLLLLFVLGFVPSVCVFLLAASLLVFVHKTPPNTPSPTDTSLPPLPTRDFRAHPPRILWRLCDPLRWLGLLRR
jgi:hypothetical protein